MKIGLTLMKVAPMHIGHSFLITEALKQVDCLYIVVYDCPDKTSIPLPQRCNWVRTLFPKRVFVIEGYDAPNVHENTEEVKTLQETYIKNLMRDTKITHFFSSEEYGEHMSLSLNAQNCVIDIRRANIPISSTAIRANLSATTSFLPKPVARDILKPRILIIPPNDRARRESINKLDASNLGFVISDTKGNGIPFIIKPILSTYIYSLLTERKYDRNMFLKACKEISKYDTILIDQALFNIEKNSKESQYFLASVTAHLRMLNKPYLAVENYKDIL